MSEFNPLLDPVVERSYTKDTIKAEIGELDASQQEMVIPEPTYEIPSFSDDANPEPSQTSSGSQSSGGGGSSQTKQPLNEDLQDLDDKQKRKLASKSADSLLNIYGNVIPIPFIKLASFNEKKVEMLNLQGEIDFNTVLDNEGLTVKSFIETHNRDVVDAMEFTEDARKSIKDPLVDVLMEQGLALTNTQRLMIAVGTHVAGMTFSAIQLSMSKNNALETFKEFRRQEAREGRTYVQPQPQPATQTVAPDVTETTSEYEQPSFEEEDVPQQYEDVKVEKEVAYEKPPVSMDEYINDDSITIEEVEN